MADEKTALLLLLQRACAVPVPSVFIEEIEEADKRGKGQSRRGQEWQGEGLGAGAAESAVENVPEAERILDDCLEELNYLNSVQDPVETPFKHKYKARAILVKLLGRLQPLLSSLDRDEQLDSLTSQDAAMGAEEAEEAKERLRPEGGASSLGGVWEGGRARLAARLKRANEGAEEHAARVRQMLGLNLIDCEEWGQGVQFLTKALALLDGEALQNKYSVELIKSHNALGIVWASREKPEVACTHLTRSMEIYQAMAHKASVGRCLQRELTAGAMGGQSGGDGGGGGKDGDGVGAGSIGALRACLPYASARVHPVSVGMVRPLGTSRSYQSGTCHPASLLCSDDLLLPLTVEALATHTMFYLAQVFGQLKRETDSATFCNKTMIRQLVLPVAPGDQALDRSEFVKNALGLAIFYSSESNRQMAHHCLEVATKMLPPGSLPVAPNDDTDDPNQHLAATVARSWGNFYLEWLRHCRLLEYNRLTGATQVPLQAPALDAALLFPLDGLRSPPPTCRATTNLDVVKDIFRKGQSWFTQARNFFVLDGYVTDHIQTVQETSQLFGAYVNFEADLSRQSKLQKRRVDMLEPIIPQINKQIYLDFYQQLCDEVARAYTAMADLKIELNSQRPMGPQKAQAIGKINKLCLKAITRHHQWLNAFDDPSYSTKAPEAPASSPSSSSSSQRIAGVASVAGGALPFTVPYRLDPHYRPAYLHTIFTLARTWNKVFYPDKEAYVGSLERSLSHFQLVADLQEQWNVDKVEFARDIEVVREMRELLPIKISKIKDGSFL